MAGVIESGSATEMLPRILAIAMSIGPSASRCSSRAVRSRTERLRSCCETARMRSWRSISTEPTRFAATRAALTTTVAVAWYVRGSSHTSSTPTTIDNATGTMNHHLRRLNTEI